MLLRLGLFFVFACLVAFGAHLFFGSIILAQSLDDSKTITLRDVYYDNEHDLSGMVMVASSCADLTARAQDIDAHKTAVVFETWEEPVSDCTRELTPRAVHVIAFGPADLEFRGLLNGELVPLTVVFSVKH